MYVYMYVVYLCVCLLVFVCISLCIVYMTLCEYLFISLSSPPPAVSKCIHNRALIAGILFTASSLLLLPLSSELVD